MKSKRIAIAAAAAATIAAAVVVPTASANQNTLGNNGCGAPVNAPSQANPPLPVVGLVGYALDSAGAVYCFDTARVQRAKKIAEIVHPDGAQRFLAMDFRPFDGLLYFIGSDSRLFTYDVNSGVLSAGVAISPALTPADVAAGIGIDFNPTVATSATPGNADLRVVTGAGNNYAVNVNVIPATLTVQTALNYSGSPALGVTGAAYTNEDRYAATGTRLFDIDTNLDQLVEQGAGNPPAFGNGALSAYRALGANSTANAEIDIYTAISEGLYTNTGFFAIDTTAAGSRLFKVDLTIPNSQAIVTLVPIGAFPDNIKIVGLAIALEQH